MQRIVIGLLAALLIGPAIAQDAGDARDYPNRAIRIIVPFPAGGPSDVLARIIGQKMSEDWGQPVLIENRVGANTVIGAQVGRKGGARRLHAADGHRFHPDYESISLPQPAVRSAQ